MSGGSIANWLEGEWTQIDREAAVRKDLGGAVSMLADVYRNLTAVQRPAADEVITGWAVSTNPTKRFDGLMLIDKFGILSAMPRLKQLADSLRNSREPWALHDRAMIDGIVRRLSRREAEAE